MTNERHSRRVMQHLKRWDFIGSLVIAIGFLAAVFASDRPLDEAAGPLTAAITLGVALALGAAVASRWLGDSSKDETYGEVLRAIDPQGRRAQQPFMIVVAVGVVTSLWGGVLLMAEGEFPRTLAGWFYALEVLLAAYGLLAMLDVLLLGFRHQRRQSALRALRESEQRRTGPPGSRPP